MVIFSKITMKNLVETIRENCIGYFYNWSFDQSFSFSKELFTLIPKGYIHQIPPINRLTAWWHGIPSFHINFKGSVNHQESKEKKFWEKNRNIFVYHTPLNLNNLIKLYLGEENHRKFFEERGLPLGNLDKPRFPSAEEYLTKLKEAFDQPFFIHHRKPYRPGASIEFYLIGEKEHTREFTDFLLEQPHKIKDFILEVCQMEEKYLGNGEYGHQDKLVLFDTTRKPKKQIVEINWETG